MRRHRIRALAGHRFRPCTTDSRHYLPIAPNLLAQCFVATTPNRIWLADITYIATGEGQLYLAAVLDLATRKIVGWAMRDHMRTELPLATLMMAGQRQRASAGSHLPLRPWVAIRSRRLCRPSGGDGCGALDEPYRQLLRQCPMESFFHTLKVELVHQCRWATQAEARQALFGYIEGYYNRYPMHSAIGYLTPEQAEQRLTGQPSVSAKPGDDQGRGRVVDGHGRSLPGVNGFQTRAWSAVTSVIAPSSTPGALASATGQSRLGLSRP